MKKVAVVLCGSGFKDGSEIRESVGVYWALSAEGAEVKTFALDEPQYDVVNCLTGETVSNEKRNQLVEAARIARGKIEPLAKLNSQDFDVLVLPGGFGAAKNLCSFAREGSKGSVHPELARVLKSFHDAGKPIGAVCIAPAILAMTFPNAGFELTLGGFSEAAQEIEKLGHQHVVKNANEFHFDKKNNIATSPAYMWDDAKVHEIFDGIRGMVKALI